MAHLIVFSRRYAVHATRMVASGCHVYERAHIGDRLPCVAWKEPPTTILRRVVGITGTAWKEPPTTIHRLFDP